MSRKEKQILAALAVALVVLLSFSIATGQPVLQECNVTTHC